MKHGRFWQSAAAAVALGLFATLALVPATGLAQPAAGADARLRELESTLRCLVCQNQTLADSDAPLAADLRREIGAMAAQGASDADIRAFLVARYGDFVLYDPPLKPVTLLLWLGPFTLLIAGAVIWWRVPHGARMADAADAGPAADAATARAQALLEEP